MSMRLFDVQCGFGGLKTGSREVLPADGLLAELDRLQIEKALVRISPEDLDRDVAGSNERLFAACDASAGKWAPCPIVLPATGGDVAEEAAQVEGLLARGAAAAVVRPTLDMWPLEEWCGGKLLAALEAHRVPVLCMTKLVPLADVARLAQAHPRLPLVVAETDYRSQRALGGLLGSFPNVYLSVGSNYAVHLGLETLAAQVGAERLLFGTGLPRVQGMMAVTHLMYSELTDSQKQAIGWDNLHRLIGGIRK